MRQKFVFQWHITHRCNLRCRHCYQEEYGTDLSEQELIEIFYQMREYLQEKGFVGHINFTGGEPLLSGHLWSLLDLCEKYHISFGILTNGTLLKKETVERLARYKGIRFVQVSIDGKKSTHDKIRGEGNFDKTMSAISFLRQYRIQSMVSFTCSRQNYKELKEVIRICEQKKADRFWTDRLIPTGSNQLETVSTEEYMDYMKVLGKESRRAARNPLVKTKVHTNRALQFFCKGEENCYNCSAGRTLLTILADGTLLPCRRLPLEIGNVTEHKISDLLSGSEVIQQLRKAELPLECRQCRFRCNCKGGAKCLTYAVTGQISARDVNCPFENSINGKKV